METRIKWLRSSRIELAFLREIEVAMRQMPFTRDSSKGFILEKLREGSLGGKFVERVDGNRILIDPFGNKVELRTLNYETTEFVLSTAAPQLEFRNAARGLRRLLLLLGEIAGTEIAVSEPEIDVFKWVQISAKGVSSLDVNLVECSDVSITGATAADVVFYGNRSVRRDAEAFLGKRSFAVRRVSGVVREDNRDFRCSFFQGGKFRITPDPHPKILATVRASLRSLCAQGS